MKVYFEENYWGKGRGKKPGRKVAVEKEFAWDGRKWRIPALYLCEEGVVMDVCVGIPREEIKEFMEKWDLERRSHAETFTQEEIEQLEQESPFCMRFRMRAEADGVELGSEGWCGTAWNPLTSGEEAVTEIEETLMEVYGCSRDSGWYFCRAHFRFPGADGETRERQTVETRERLTPGVGEEMSCEPALLRMGEERENLRTLTVFFEKETEKYPGPHFRTKAGERGSRVAFSHPISGRQYVLTVESCEQKNNSQDWPKEEWAGNIRIRKSPSQCLELCYTVEPEIDGEELWIADLAESDPPEFERKGGAAAKRGVAVLGGADTKSDTATESDAEAHGGVEPSIIGGADGPVAIFVAGKLGEERPGGQVVYSSLHYEPVAEAEWRMVFRVREDSGIKIQMDF